MPLVSHPPCPGLPLAQPTPTPGRQVSKGKLHCSSRLSHLPASHPPAHPPTPLQVNKGKLWDSTQVDEGLPEVWLDLSK